MGTYTRPGTVSYSLTVSQMAEVKRSEEPELVREFVLALLRLFQLPGKVYINTRHIYNNNQEGRNMTVFGDILEKLGKVWGFLLYVFSF